MILGRLKSTSILRLPIVKTPPLNSQIGSTPTYFAALDGFRGLLALCVAIFHTYWFSHINSTTFFNNGPVIIDLFFVFSGFLLYGLYGRNLRTPDDGAKFLKKRFARLYPIHVFMLLLFIAFALVRIFANELGLSTQEPEEILPFQKGSDETLWSILSHLTLTHSMGVSDSLTFNPPSWTISVEFFAYFVFVLMLLWCPPKKPWHFALMSVCVAVLYGGLSLVKPNMDITHDLGFFRCLAGFLTGVVACWVFEHIKSSAYNPHHMARGGRTLLEVIALGGFVAFVIYMPGKLQFCVGPFAFIFVLVFAFDAGLISKFLSKPIFGYFAKISYSVYMVHAIFAVSLNIIGERMFPAIHIEGHWAGDVFLIPYMIAVIGFSHLTWRFIERPGQKMILGFKSPLSRKQNEKIRP